MPTNNGSMLPTSGTGGLSPAQLAAIDHLLAGKTITATAEAVGANRATVSGWVHHHRPFILALQHRRAELWETSKVRLEALGQKAADVLAGLLDDPSPRVRLAASKVVLGTLAASKHGAGSVDDMPALGTFAGGNEWPVGATGQTRHVRGKMEPSRGLAMRSVGAVDRGTRVWGASVEELGPLCDAGVSEAGEARPQRTQWALERGRDGSGWTTPPRRTRTRE